MNEQGTMDWTMDRASEGCSADGSGPSRPENNHGNEPEGDVSQGEHRIRHVLLVDDDPADRLLVQHMLKNCGVPIELHEATDADSAAECYHHQELDCILLDYNLADTTGDKVLTDIISGEYATQVITLTSADNATISHQMLAGGAVDFLLKDELTPQALQRALSFAFSRRSFQLRLRAYEQKNRELVNELSAANRRLIQQQKTLQERADDLSGEVARREHTELLLQKQQQQLEKLVDLRTRQYRDAEQRAVDNARHAEAASQSKTEFLASVSHELRTPLNGVVGMVDLLAGTRLSPEQQEYVSTIQDSAQSLLAIIGNTLDISRIEAGNIKLQPRRFSPLELVRSVQRLEQAAARRKHLRFEVDIDDDLPAQLVGDPQRLQQILTNLVDNAIKYTATGHVGLRCRLLKQGDKDCELQFQISDTGPGIAATKRDALFQPYRQLQPSTQALSGVGLGLAIVTRLVQLMDADIALDSNLGEGSVFSVTVRLTKADPAVPETLSPTPPNTPPNTPPSTPPEQLAQQARHPTPEPVDTDALPPLRVLVVEDNHVNRYMVERMLRKLGCSVVEADNGHTALELLARESCDLVLMDVNMPGIDGLETTRRLRARQAEQAASPIPIIALTANAVVGDRERCLEAGMDDYLSKPFVLTDIAEKLAKWSQREIPAAAQSSDHRDRLH